MTSHQELIRNCITKPTIIIDPDNYVELINEFGNNIIPTIKKYLDDYNENPFDAPILKKYDNKFKKQIVLINQDYQDEQQQDEKIINFWTIKDYFDLKDNNKFIIKDIMQPKDIAMRFGQSGSFKSLEMLYRAICIASGRKYLDKYRTKKQPVLILSAENSVFTDKKRIRGVLSGLKLRKKDFELYIIPRQECGDILDENYKNRLFKLIKELAIKVLFIDTINPLTPMLDDNSAKDVTSIFNEFLKPLSELGCYVEFLHHTDKKGNNFLGSTKFKANCDTVFRIERKGGDDTFFIYNEKNREGEKNTLNIKVTFEDHKTFFELLDDTKKANFNKKAKGNPKQNELINTIIGLDLNYGKFFEIDKALKKLKINYSRSSLIRALKYFSKDDNKTYDLTKLKDNMDLTPDD